MHLAHRQLINDEFNMTNIYQRKHLICTPSRVYSQFLALSMLVLKINESHLKKKTGSNEHKRILFPCQVRVRVCVCVHNCMTELLSIS